MRSIPASMNENTISWIDICLDDIAAEHGVAIPLAVESGSRAWGFPSPDSDYDCRFFFIRSAESYLSLWVKRDVIEMPLNDELDINGWDLCKALQLLIKGNATVIEWLRLHPQRAVAPMHFPTLMGECDPPANLVEIVEALIARKTVTRELGTLSTITATVQCPALA